MALSDYLRYDEWAGAYMVGVSLGADNLGDALRGGIIEISKKGYIFEGVNPDASKKVYLGDGDNPFIELMQGNINASRFRDGAKRILKLAKYSDMEIEEIFNRGMIQ